MAVDADEVVVPDTQQAKHQRKVPVWFGMEEMLVHPGCPIEQLDKSVITQRNGDRQSDGRPEGITTPDRFRKPDHSRLGNTKIGSIFNAGSNGDGIVGRVADT